MEFSQERNDALNFLQDHPLGTLATIQEHGSPELAAVYFIAERDLTCYMVTKTETRKFKNIEKNPNVSLLVYDEELLYSVEVSGMMTVVHDTPQKIKAIENFQTIASSRRAQYWLPPISQLEAGNYVVCKLVPEVVHIRSFAADLQSNKLPKHLSFNP